MKKRTIESRNLFSSLAGTMVLTSLMFISCGRVDDGISGIKEDFAYESYLDMGEKGEDGSDGYSDPSVNPSGNTSAGTVTAGEWNDLNNWPFWSTLMTSEDFSEKSDYWKFYTNNRVAVLVTDGKGEPMPGVIVQLLWLSEDSKPIWTAVTDNHGEANCWLGAFQKDQADANRLIISLNGQAMAEHPVVSTWDEQGKTVVNKYIAPKASPKANRADIAFIVDATGSMKDEIDFLKSDMVDIIGKAGSLNPSLTLRTAALFYRDEGDDYLTRHSAFTQDLRETARYVGQQQAGGGGDYPEAVHSALEHMLQDLAWDDQARNRLAFLILDAPAHHETKVIESLQESVRLCAVKGIRLIPVAASGVDKNTEFMLRFFATITGGTYVFLTNDSGVGNDHIAASVGQYEVEQLNELLIRLINYYTE